MTAPSRTRSEYPPEHLLAWTPRQRQVLDLLAKGRSNPQIAEALDVSLEGAKWHVREIMSKLDVDSREDAAEYWRRRNGLPARLRRTAAGIFTGWSAKTAAAGAGVVVGVIGVAVLAFVLLNSGGDPAPIAPGETTTPPAGETTTPTPPIVVGHTIVMADPAGNPDGSGLGDVRIVTRGPGQGAGFVIEQAWLFPGGLQLVDASVYASHHYRISRYPLDGSASETVVSAPEGSELLGFSVSPDETRIAYWRSPAGFETPEQSAMTLVLQELDSGAVLAEVDDLEAFDAFGQHVGWMPGGESVLVNIGSSHDRGLRVVGLDGTVTPIVLDPNVGSFGGPAQASPPLTTAFYPVSAFGSGCQVAAPKNEDFPPLLRGMRDLVTNADYWQVETDRVAVAAYGSPDGTSFLYAEPDCGGEDEQSLLWYTVSTTEATPQSVAEPAEVLRDWHGDDLVWGRCDDGSVTLPQMPGLGYHAVVYADLGPNTCPGTLELLAGDTVLGELDPNEPAPVVLGFVEGQP